VRYGLGVVDVEGIVGQWNNGSDGNIIGCRHRKLGNHMVP